MIKGKSKSLNSKRSRRSLSIGRSSSLNGKSNTRARSRGRSIKSRKNKSLTNYSDKNGQVNKFTTDQIKEINKILKKLAVDATPDDMMTIEESHKYEEESHKNGSNNYEDKYKKGGSLRAPLLRSASRTSPLTPPITNSWALNLIDYPNTTWITQTLNRWTYNWPQSYGCIPSQQNNRKLIGISKYLDRFGGENGIYLGEPSSSYKSRSLFYITPRHKDDYNAYYTSAGNSLLPDNYKYHKYYSTIPYYTYSCLIAPAFEHPGGGRQYLFPVLPFILYTNLTSDNPGMGTNITVSATQRFYKISYLIKKNVLLEVPVTTFPTWE